MFLKDYHQDKPEGFAFTRAQASLFAKGVASDFNPIHDEDAKRFCVPGDLLFAMLVSKVGLHQKMRCNFSGMVGSEVTLHLECGQDHALIKDAAGKEYLDMAYSGELSRDEALIEHLIRRYVYFSGQNFPPILLPLMKDKGVMLNPARPLVMYQNMAIDLKRVDLKAPDIVFTGATLDVEGKRGNALLRFDFVEDGEVVGSGEKLMVLSGLVPYEQAEMDKMVAFYFERKAAFAA
ncbi:DUF3581 family protein [Gallaecimonas kandeliae]|uniref:DUF3581 family protein n=1 Tax=Gallaecimonas kandeliae TaxID=3029055 RepID=UPI002649CDB7|nr:DUF3581 family protein [Gallaecimonas kandeliae]WKE64086.1 DUF3581 family protein [Gallaecimonas kandeliae]